MPVLPHSFSGHHKYEDSALPSSSCLVPKAQMSPAVLGDPSSASQLALHRGLQRFHPVAEHLAPCVHCLPGGAGAKLSAGCCCRAACKRSRTVTFGEQSDNLKPCFPAESLVHLQ